MKKREFHKEQNGIKYYKTYSDKGFYILQEQTNRKYTVAVDREDSNYTYIETDEKTPQQKKLEEEEVKNGEHNS